MAETAGDRCFLQEAPSPYGQENNPEKRAIDSKNEVFLAQPIVVWRE
jgi:hypothetical protein